MRKIYVVAARHTERKEGSNREWTRSQVVSHVDTDILDVSVVVAIVNWQLMGFRPVVLGKHKRDTDIQCQLVRDSEIDVFGENKRANVANVQPLTI
jgi:hypothetical protein